MEQASETRTQSTRWSENDLDTINDCIRNYNDERPDDRIALVKAGTNPSQVARIIRYLGIVL